MMDSEGKTRYLVSAEATIARQKSMVMMMMMMVVKAKP